MSLTIGDGLRQLATVSDDWRRSQTIGDCLRRLATVSDNWRRSQTIGDGLRPVPHTFFPHLINCISQFVNKSMLAKILLRSIIYYA